MTAAVLERAPQANKAFLHINKAYVLLLSAIAALGGVLFGFDTAIISGAISFLKIYFKLNELSVGWAVSSILIGCGLGAMMAGKVADVLGRKKTLLICALLFAATGIGVAIASSFSVFVSFRMAGGLAVGAAAMVVPMYIAETVPATLRGRMVALYQLAIVLGILLAYVVDYLLAGIGNHAWRWMFGSQALPAGAFFVLLFFVPDTPRWLIQKGFTAKGYNVLSKTGGKQYADSEMEAITNSFGKEERGSMKDLLHMRYRSVMEMGILIAVFQQITGINAILYYAPEIFKNTGVSAANAAVQTIDIGIVMLLFTLVAIWLVDKVGRKKLLLTGCVLMALSLTGVAVCFGLQFYGFYLVLVFLMLYIAGFSASLGAVTWVILSEMFPNRIRGLALSLTTLALWLADFAASFSFPVFNKHLGTTITLLIFAVLCVVYFVYIKLKVPETKGETLEQLEVLLSDEQSAMRKRQATAGKV